MNKWSILHYLHSLVPAGMTAEEEDGAAELLSLGKEELLDAVRESLSTGAGARGGDGDVSSMG